MNVNNSTGFLTLKGEIFMFTKGVKIANAFVILFSGVFSVSALAGEDAHFAFYSLLVCFYSTLVAIALEDV